MKICEEFKSFAFKGNLIDMAAGIMIGSESHPCHLTKRALPAARSK